MWFSLKLYFVVIFLAVSKVPLNDLVLGGAGHQRTPLSSAWALQDAVSTVTDQTAHEHTGIKSLPPAMTNSCIFPEKCQFTVCNSSPRLLIRNREQCCMHWKHPELGEFSELDFPQHNSVYTLMLRKIYLETLNNHQRLQSLFVLRWWVLPAVRWFLERMAHQTSPSFLNSAWSFMLSKQMMFPSSSSMWWGLTSIRK